MSKIGEIKKIIERLFEDGNIHTNDEIIKIALDENIITDEKDKSISNALFQFKKNNPDFESVGRGMYQKKVSDELKSLNQQVDFIISEIKNIGKFNWIDCDEQELLLEREKITKIKKIVSEYEKIIKSK